MATKVNVLYPAATAARIDVIQYKRIDLREPLSVEAARFLRTGIMRPIVVVISEPRIEVL